MSSKTETSPVQNHVPNTSHTTPANPRNSDPRTGILGYVRYSTDARTTSSQQPATSHPSQKTNHVDNPATIQHHPDCPTSKPATSQYVEAPYATTTHPRKRNLPTQQHFRNTLNQPTPHTFAQPAHTTAKSSSVCKFRNTGRISAYTWSTTGDFVLRFKRSEILINRSWCARAERGGSRAKRGTLCVTFRQIYYSYMYYVVRAYARTVVVPNRILPAYIAF